MACMHIGRISRILWVGKETAAEARQLAAALRRSSRAIYGGKVRPPAPPHVAAACSE